MDLKSGYPYWAVKNGLMYAFPRLEADLQCDVLVIGAGISGALIARRLAAESLDVAIVEQRDIAWGSTAASTALLQYEIDTPLVDLAKRYDEALAVRMYRTCADAVTQLHDIAHDTGTVGFRYCDSLYFASSWLHRARLRAEYALRRQHGFDVQWLSRDEIQERYGFTAPAALLSKPAARVDPYRFASRLLDRLSRRGVRVFDRTCVTALQPYARGVDVTCAEGVRVRAAHVVLATGYAAQQWLLQKVAKNRSSYAFVTDPLGRDELGPWARTIVWETARPYLYARSTSDRRLIIGGEDDAVDIPARRDARVEKKAQRLCKRAARLFPKLRLTPAFAWGGTFAETDDGLPWFGAHPQYGPRVLFALAYGGNGITYSALGGEVIAAAIKRRTHPLAKACGFRRAR